MSFEKTVSKLSEVFSDITSSFEQKSVEKKHSIIHNHDPAIPKID
jgi:hypothetical protein